MAEENKAAAEQIYTIPLKAVKDYPNWKRGNKAIKVIREYLSKHMKVAEDEIKISKEINEIVWERGIEKPPRKIRVKAVRSEEGVTAEVVEAEKASEKAAEKESKKAEKKTKAKKAAEKPAKKAGGKKAGKKAEKAASE